MADHIKKIGVFGGTFDPIHLGHINLAIEMKEKGSFDEILFIPANISPNKTRKPPIASEEHRLQMTKLAIKDIDDFSVISEEIDRGGVSYTIDTLNKIINNNNEYRLILTEENLTNFHLWKDYQKILDLAPLLVGVRKNFIDSYEKFNLSKNNFIKTKIFEISSTVIRERLKKDLYSYHLLPKEVLDYIYQHQLY